MLRVYLSTAHGFSYKKTLNIEKADTLLFVKCRLFVFGVPDKIRTCDLQLRRLLLYPAELLGHLKKILFNIFFFSILT